MRIINKLPLMALALGLGFIITMSSFKKVQDPIYGYDPLHLYSSETWFPLTGVAEGDDPEEYFCDGNENVCTVEFEDAPNNSTPPPVTGFRPGTFSIVPQP